MPLVVCITEGVPVADMVRVERLPRELRRRASSAPTARASSRRGRRKIGIMPGHIHKDGPVGVVSRSGTLTYEAVAPAHPARASASPPASASAAIPSSARTSSTCCASSRTIPGTEAIIMIGEIGGSAEEEAAAFVKAHVKKPVVGFIAARRRRRAGAWAMPAPSSRAARARPPRRCGPWRPPASTPSRVPPTWAPPWPRSWQERIGNPVDGRRAHAHDHQARRRGQGRDRADHRPLRAGRPQARWPRKLAAPDTRGRRAASTSSTRRGRSSAASASS